MVIVIVGASSGIGLVTSRMAAKRDARIVLVARSEEALVRFEQELSNSGRKAHMVVADVGKPEDVQRIARVARESSVGSIRG